MVRRLFQLPPIASGQADCVFAGDRMIKQIFFSLSPYHTADTRNRDSARSKDSQLGELQFMAFYSQVIKLI